MIGLALIMYGREEGADTLIEQMTRDQVGKGGIVILSVVHDCMRPSGQAGPSHTHLCGKSPFCHVGSCQTCVCEWGGLGG